MREETMESLVSVIIPCYNAEKFIDKGLQSIYEQDYSCVEIIVINDGSTDKSEEIILDWKERFYSGSVVKTNFYAIYNESDECMFCSVHEHTILFIA